MILCHRVYGSSKDLVMRKAAEQGFRLLTWKLSLTVDSAGLKE